MSRLDELREDQDHFLRHKKALETLSENEGYVLYLEELKSLVRAKQAEMAKLRIRTQDDAFGHADKGGQLNGLEMAMELPLRMIDMIEESLQAIETEISITREELEND